MPENLSAPDPGPRPEEEHLTNDEIIAKYAPLIDSYVERAIIAEMVYARKLAIAIDLKTKKETAAEDAWMAAYVRRYGTDEG